MPHTSDDGPWLTISEAAERTGRKIDAMRALVRRGRLPRKKGNRGEWLVQLPETLPQAALDIDSDSNLDPDLDGASGSELIVIREQLVELREGLTQAVERAARAEGELAAELRRSAELAATMAAERARGDRLEAALAEARRPLLLRLVEGLRRRGAPAGGASAPPPAPRAGNPRPPPRTPRGGSRAPFPGDRKAGPGGLRAPGARAGGR